MLAQCVATAEGPANPNTIARPLTDVQSPNRPAVLDRLRPAPALAVFLVLALTVGLTTLAGVGDSLAGAVTVSTRDGWQAGINSTTPTDLNVTFHGVSGIKFGGIDPRVSLTRANIYMLGGTDSGLTTTISNINSALLNLANSQRSASDTVFGGLMNTQLTTFSQPNNYIIIDGLGAARGISSPNQGDFDAKKVIYFTKDENGLLVKNLRFSNFEIAHIFTSTTKGGVINPFIGSLHNNTLEVTMRGFNDSIFDRINLTMTGSREDHWLAGGGIIGLRSTSELTNVNDPQNVEIDVISGNYFNEITVTTKAAINNGYSPYIEGGGIIGLDAVSSPDLKYGSAILDTLRSNYFKSITINSGDMLLGGGLVGVNNNAQNPSNVSLGLYSETRLNSVTRNVFGNGETGNITVSSYYSLRGGGVLGVNSLSNATSILHNLDSNVFAGIQVSAGSYLRGGGVVGVQSKCTDTDPSGSRNNCSPTLSANDVTSYLGSATNNLFYNIQVDVGTKNTGTGLDGGGIIGANAYNNLVNIDTISYNIFKNISVTVDDADTGAGALHGGGIVGVSSLQKAAINIADHNYFENINVTIAKELHGGGIIGASTSSTTHVTDQFAILGRMNNNTFKSIEIKTENGDIKGGGVIGIAAEAGSTQLLGLDGDYNIIGMDHNLFNRINVTSNRGIYGGGILGHYVKDGYAFMGPLNYNDFFGNVINASFIEGGGIVGVNSQSYGVIYSLDSDNFIANTISVERYIDGGGIIGVTAPSNQASGDPLIGIREIKNSYFSSNTVTARNGIIMGGLIYAYGTVDAGSGGMTIQGSWFENNIFEVQEINLAVYDTTGYNGTYIEEYGVYGTVTIDTGNNNNTDDYAVVKLVSTPDSSVVFNNNVIKFANKDDRNNSLYFGGIPEYDYVDGTGYTIKDDQPAVDAKLIIDTSQGGTVGLFDPILVDQTGSVNANKTFTMEVIGGGDFLWGGANEVYTDPGALGAGNSFNLLAGSRTTITKGMTLKAENHLFNLKPDARLNVIGSNKFTVNQADLNGIMYFNIAASTANVAATSLLTIDNKATAFDPNAKVNVENAIVTLGDLPAGSALQPGTVFYLIDTLRQEGITTNQQTKMATARQGLLTKYNFTIDNYDDLSISNGAPSNQYLVARLVTTRPPEVGPPLVVYEHSETGDPLVVYFKTAVDNPLMVEIKTAVGEPLVVYVKDPAVSGDPPVVYVKTATGEPLVVYVKEPAVSGDPPYVEFKTAVGEPLFVLLQDITPNPSYSYFPDVPYLELYHESKLMTAGQAANIGLLSLTWLPDHSYESADMALRLSEKAWAPFGGLDYAMVQSGRDTKIRTDSARIMAGVAWQRPADSSDFLASLFIEGIKGRYHLDADYGTIFADHPHIKAKGDIDAVDIGLMIRQKWHNGLRLEASGRYGVSRNEFNSSDFTNSLGHTMNYKTRTPFWSVHAGVGYEHKLSERSTLDLVARYYFTRLDSDRVTLDSGEQVSFKAVDSSRVRAGGRFSMRHTERITWYAGAYYEHELKGKSVGEHLGIQFEADELKGGTGIGELGVSFRSTPDHPWNVEAGIQIYAGRNRGYSGGVRFGYEF